LDGAYGGDEVVHTIRPFREFETKMLPTKAARDDFKNNWAPILRLMEEAPGVAGGLFRSQVKDFRTFSVPAIFR